MRGISMSTGSHPGCCPQHLQRVETSFARQRDSPAFEQAGGDPRTVSEPFTSTIGTRGSA